MSLPEPLLGQVLTRMPVRRQFLIQFFLATDLADYLVCKGVAFRDAHHVVGELVALAEDKNVPLDKLEDFDVSKVHDALASDWRDVFRLETAFKSREKVGMPGPIQIEQQIKRWRDTLKA